MSVASPNFVEGGELFKSKEQKTKTAKATGNTMKNPPQCHHCFPGQFLQLLYFPKVRHLNTDLNCVRRCMFRCLGQRGTAGICLSLWHSLGTVMLPFRDRPHPLWYQGYWQAELHRGRKAHPSSKHSNLTTTKSSAKINKSPNGGKSVMQRATLLMAQQSPGYVHLGLCFTRRKTTPIVGLCKAQRTG